MDSRALIFSNLLNGVPVEQVAKDFQKSKEEIEKIFSFVLRKVKSYCFQRSIQKNALPIITASSLSEAKRQRLTCLSVLPKLNLDKDPMYKDIQSEIVTPDNCMSIARNLNV